MVSQQTSILQKKESISNKYGIPFGTNWSLHFYMKTKGIKKAAALWAAASKSFKKLLLIFYLLAKKAFC